MSKEYTIAALVENKSGVLAHIAGLFSGRGYNISELSVGETENADYSRMTIVVKGDDQVLEKIQKQLNLPAVHRELILVKVKASSSLKQEIFQIAEVFKGKVVDISLDTLTLETTGISDKIEAFVNILKPYGILEIARTGRASISRGISKGRVK